MLPLIKIKTVKPYLAYPLNDIAFSGIGVSDAAFRQHLLHDDGVVAAALTAVDLRQIFRVEGAAPLRVKELRQIVVGVARVGVKTSLVGADGNSGRRSTHTRRGWVKSINGSVNERINQWINGSVDERINQWINGSVDE